MSGRMIGLNRIMLTALAALLITVGCSEQAADMRTGQDVTIGGDLDVVFDDIFGFLDSYTRRGLAAGTDPTLIILGPSNSGKVECVEPATSVDFVMMAQNWDYPQAGRSLSCYIDGGAYAGGDPDGSTDDLEYTFADVPCGYHRLCCVMVEDGEELTNCDATACVNLSFWQLCDVAGDPICDDDNPVSASACLWDYNLQHRKCVYGPMDVEDLCLSKHDCECSEGIGWEVCVNNTCIECEEDDHCDDGDPCTVDTCNTSGAANVCEHASQLVDGQTCCSSAETEAVDCNDGDWCTSDLCVDIDGVTGMGHCENVDAGLPDCCNTHGDCDDGDPCTVNACMAHECREGPKDDPLCCNPANGDVDCDKGDPCYEAYCNPETDQCEWTAITYAEQVDQGIECCDNHPDCQAGGIWEEAPQDDPSTLDYCQDGQCVHLTDPNFCLCDEGEGCGQPCIDDGEDCTVDACNLVTNTCEHTTIEGCCLADGDCEDANVCTNDACVDGLCENTALSGCCNTHEECDDGNPCNLDACFSHACHFGPNPDLPNCCNSNADCDDLNACTEELCLVAIHECVVDVADPPPAGKECCLTVSQCDDSNPNTQDQCIKNVCYHFQYDCQPGDACDDNQPCTVDSCGPDLECLNEWIPDCCTTDLSCNLAPLMPDTAAYQCKEGTCGADNACVFTDISDCCQENADCADGDGCTTDLCVNKKCKHVSVTNCCEGNGDCNDGNDCTDDACITGSCVHTVNYDQGGGGVCCGTGGDCADGDACTQDLCIGNLCYHTPIEDCCAADSQCADLNACTCDLCIYGKCRHLPPGQAANYPACSVPLLCCEADGDCESDDNPCTVDSCLDNLCDYALQDPCNLPLPYTQGFTDCNNVQAGQGWLTGLGFDFVELGGNSGTGNWKCSNDGPLGADKHQRFNWAPTVTDFDSYLVTPALDCTGYDFVTVMYRQEFDYYDDVTPKTGIDLGLYLVEESGDVEGADVKDTFHALAADTLDGDFDAEWTYATAPAATGLLTDQTFFAWRVGGESSYALNHFDLDDVRICPGRPPVFSDPVGDEATISMSMDEEADFIFVVADPDDTLGKDLQFELIGAPSWVKIFGYKWDAAAKQYEVRIHASGGDNAAKIGDWEFTLRAKDVSNTVAGNACLFVDVDVTLWVMVTDGYVIWDPQDGSGNHSDTFSAALYDSIVANDRRVQIVDDITLFEDLDDIRGVFVTLGIQGLDYVLTDQADADAPAIDLLSDYLAGGGRVYLEGGNTWGFDTATDLHSQYYFPVVATAGTPELFGASYPPGAVDGKHFCWGQDFLVSETATLAYGVDTLAKKVGSAAIPVIGLADGEQELAVSFESATFGCRTLAVSLPFAALVDGVGTRDELMGLYISFFENGYPPCTVNNQCSDSEICTVDTCVDDACVNQNEADCIPCEDDQPCTASSAVKACAVSSGICGALLGTEHVSSGGAQTITYGADVTSTISVAAGDLVQGVNVKLYITHNYRGDLEITLTHGGVTAALKAADPTDNGKQFYFTYDFGLDSDEMEAFEGTSENGDWTLTIKDTSAPYDGALVKWSLFIVSAQTACTLDSQCDDANACTIDSCQIPIGDATGFCVFSADPCDDFNACQVFDSCDADGVGCIYADLDCDDGNPCSDDDCDETTGCVNDVAQHCTTPCTTHGECGYDDYCDLSGGTPGVCTPIPNDVTTYCVDCPKTVADQATTTSAMSLTDTGHYIDQLYVKVMLAHSYQGQLTLTLSNGDTTVTLHELTGGAEDDLYKVYELADPVHEAGTLAEFHHHHPAGTWTLSMTDAAAGDSGTLEYWTVYVLHGELLANGEACDNEDMCLADFCGNGFCCVGAGTGDCCATATDCQNGGGVTYWSPSSCESAADCQGHSVKALCVANECVASETGDDSVCEGLQAAPCADCRPNPVCTADVDQDDPLVRCPATCGNDDTQCSATCFCDGTAADPTGICVALKNLGETCDEESDCDTGLQCQNGICCTEGAVCCTHWSQCADESGELSPLDPAYAAPTCGPTPATCQGTRKDKVCQDYQCSFELIDDDSGCTDSVVHSDCGYYLSVTCDGTADQSPACATSCGSDADCDAVAHCDAGTCVGDHESGLACDEADGLGGAECISAHCSNGLCCSAGDCCAADGDCAGLGYDVAPWCATPLTCQGLRKDAVCEDNTCKSSANIDDDSACDQLIDCAPYAYGYCDGASDQPIASCPTTCSVDADCVDGAHCATGGDGLLHCYYDKTDCSPCDGDWDCVSGNCGGPAGQEVCCAAGKDCVPSTDESLCDASYQAAPTCDEPGLCQGSRVDATALACACGSETVADDSACTDAVTATGIDCGCFPHPVCDGTTDQTPLCATTCGTDGDCVAGCTCDGVCTSKLSNGEACDEDGDCLSEHCSPDLVCCDLACDGTCESCGLTWETGAVVIDGDYDGGDDFDALGHRLGTGNAGIYYLLTWDDTYVYVAWEGVNLQDDNVYVAFDVDKDAAPDQGVSASYGGVSFGGDRKPEFAVVMHQGDSITYSPSNGAGGWDTAQDVCPFPASCWSHYGGWSGNGSSELRIPRSYLGSFDPDQGFAVWMWANNNAESYVWSVWPSTNPTGAGVQDAVDAQFMKTGAGQCTKRAYNTDAEGECSADCKACDGLGACMDAVVGSDPNDDCTASSSESCGQTGVCAAGACAYWDTSTPCGGAICVADGNGDITTLQGASFCTGDGSCEASGTTPCFPHLCITDACKDPCEINANCVQDLSPGPGYYCNNRALNGLASEDCEERLNDGLYCDENSDCDNGNCVEIGDVGQGPDVGVCCATACDGHCNSCVTGTCVAYADYSDPDDDCGGCETCNGLGDCRPIDPIADLDGDPKFFCAQNSLPIAETAWDCGLTGACDGLGACDKWNDGEVCHNSECANCRIEDQNDYCDAEGACVYQGPGDPCEGGLACDDSQIGCEPSCASDLGDCCQVLWETAAGPPVTHPRQCRADGACDSCDDSAVCPTDGTLCCGGDACGDVKGLLTDIGSLTYLTATEGAAADFDHAGLGVNSPDRVFSFSTADVALAVTATVTGVKDGGGAVDTWMYLRKGDCATGTVVASNDDCGGDAAAGSCLSYELDANTTYYLVIDGKGAATDKGDLTLTSTFSYYCGNGTCDPGEVCGVCADCSPCCGDGACDLAGGENSCTCATGETYALDDPATVFGAGDCAGALGSDNAFGDGCCSAWDCQNQGGADCDMCDDCTFCTAPVGALESVVHLSGDTYTVTGWACDPDHTDDTVTVEIHDEFGGLTLEGTFTTGASRPDLVGEPTNSCGELVGFTGTITLAEEGAHTIKAFGQNVDVTEDGAWLDGELCQGVCGVKVCGDDGCGASCGVCTPGCAADGDGTFSSNSDVCTLGACAEAVACGVAYACDGAASKDDGDSCATACQDGDDDYCAVGYFCEGVVCVVKLSNGASCAEDADCDSDNCRKEISSSDYYCAAAGRECSDQGGDGYEAGEAEDPWLCSATDESVLCDVAAVCDTFAGSFCQVDETWAVGTGTTHECSTISTCIGDIRYGTLRCDGAAGTAGACALGGTVGSGCSTEWLQDALHCESDAWTGVGALSCCEDQGDGTGLASDPCQDIHVDCIQSRTCVSGDDICAMVPIGTPCGASGWCSPVDPIDWCVDGLDNGEACDQDYECASKHCDADLAGVTRCHATETSCVQDETGAETVSSETFCTGGGWRPCADAAWGALTACTGCESCADGACFDDATNCTATGWNLCDSTCEKRREFSGECVSGVCTSETQHVAEGYVCTGNPAEDGEALASATVNCDLAIDCNLNACDAPRYYRGCAATGAACSDLLRVQYDTWMTGVEGEVISADHDGTGESCSQAAGSCETGGHCGGAGSATWYLSKTCSSGGNCVVEQAPDGCCTHDACGAQQYCSCVDAGDCQGGDATNECTDLPDVCTKPKPAGTGWMLQTAAEDEFDQCGTVGCLTGTCAGTAAACGVNALITPTVADQTLCAGDTATLVASGYSGIYRWYDAAVGGNLLGEGDTLVHGPLSASTTVWVEAFDGDDCVGDRAAAAITVVGLPAAPAAPSAIFLECGTTTIASGDGADVTYYWQDAADGTTTGETGNKAFTATGTHYLRARLDAAPHCWSAATAVDVTVHETPAAPAGPSIVANCEETVATPATVSGVTFYWQTSPTGQTVTADGEKTFSASGTWYLRGRLDVDPFCWSAATEVPVTVVAVPDAPVITGSDEQCEGTHLSKAAAPAGQTWYWQGDSCGESTDDASDTYTATATGTYYLRARLDDGPQCWSACDSASVNVITPLQPTAADVKRCGPGTATLAASGSTGYFEWWDAETGGNRVATGPSYTTGSLTETTTYWVDAATNPVETTYDFDGTKDGWADYDTSSCQYDYWDQYGSGVRYYSNNSWLSRTFKSPSVDVSGSSEVSLSFRHRYYLPSSNTGGYVVYRKKVGGVWQAWTHLGMASNGYNGNMSLRYDSLQAGCSSSYWTRQSFYGDQQSWRTTESVAIDVSDATEIEFGFDAVTRYMGRWWEIDWVTVDGLDGGCASPRLAVQAIVIDQEAPPAPVSIAYTCGTTTVESGTEDGSTYYWQTAPGGTAVTETGGKDFTADGTAFLRSRLDDAPNCWSTPTQVDVDVKEVPATPEIIDDYAECGWTVLTRDDPPAGTTWFWQGDTCGTATDDSAATTSVTETGTYHLRARAVYDTLECWSACDAIVVTADPEAPAPPETQGDSRCGYGPAILSASGSTGTYKWYAAATGGEPVASGSTFTTDDLDQTTTYYAEAVKAIDDQHWTFDAGLGNWTTANNYCGHVNYWAATGTAAKFTHQSNGTWRSGSLRSEEIDVSKTDSVNLTYKHRYNAVNTTYAGGYVAYRLKTGASWSAWQQFTPLLGGYDVNTTMYYDPLHPSSSCSHTTRPQYAASNSAWITSIGSIDTGTADTIQIAFAWTSRYVGSFWEVDDVQLQNVKFCASGTRTAATATVVNGEAPPAPTMNYACGVTTATPAAPPAGYTYHWQLTDDGTGYGVTGEKTFLIPTTAYLRTYKEDTAGCWSAPTEVFADVAEIPAAPGALSAAQGCAETTLSAAGTAPAGVTWYWQEKDSCGTSTDVSTETHVIDEAGVYYLRAKDDLAACWSSSCSNVIVGSIFPHPAAPTTADVKRCGTGDVTLTASGSADAYAWYTAPTGGAAVHVGDSYTPTVSETTDYYVESVDYIGNHHWDFTSGWDGWTNQSQCRSSYWTHTGGSLRFNHPNNTSWYGGWVQSPEVPVSADGVFQLEFEHRYRRYSSSSSYRDNGYVAYRLKTNGSWGSWQQFTPTSGRLYDTTENHYYDSLMNPCGNPYKQVFQSYSDTGNVTSAGPITVTGGAEAIQLAFEWTSRYYGYSYWQINDVKLTAATTCESETRAHAQAIVVDHPAAPAVPVGTQLTEACNSTAIDPGTAAGETYYWQTAPTGEALTAPGTQTFFTDTNMYLRSRLDAVPNCWSVPTMVEVDVLHTASQPTISGQTKDCGSTELTATALAAETTSIQYDYTNSYDGWTVYNDSSCSKQETWDKQSTYVEMNNNTAGRYSSALASPAYDVEGMTSITLEFNHTFYFPSTYDTAFVAYRKKVAGAWETWTTVPYGSGWATSGYNDTGERAYNDAVRGPGYNCDSYRDVPRFSGSATWTSKTAAISVTGATEFQWAFVAAPYNTGRYWRIHWSKVSFVQPSSAKLYWQTAAGGTSKDHPGETYDATVDGDYFLRTWTGNDDLDCWSAAATASSVDVVEVPGPPTVDDESRCGLGPVTFDATGAPAGGGYAWFDAASAGTTLGTNASYTTPDLSEDTNVYAASVTPYTGSSTTWNFNGTYDGWSKHNQSTCGVSNGYWTTNSSYLRNYDGNSGWRSQSMRSPVVDVSTAGSVSFEMRHRYYSYNTNRDNYRVMYRLDGGDWQQWTPTVGRTYNGNQPHRYASTYPGCSSPTVPTWYGNQSWTNSSGTIDVSTASTLELAFSATSYAYSGYWYIDWATVTLQNQCFSTTRTEATAFVENGSAPVAPDAVDDFAHTCGQTVVTPPTAPSGYTTYWQTAATGTSTTTTGPLTLTADATWYLRTKKDGDTCWSAAREVVIDVWEKPATPTIKDPSTGCGVSTLSYDGTVPAGITWYWQTAAAGESTTNGVDDFEVTADGTYYLRARNDTTGCWSDASDSATVSIHVLPTAPTAADVSVCKSESGAAVTVPLTTSGSAESYRWYTVPTGGSAVATGTSYSPSQTETTTYYVESIDSATDTLRYDFNTAGDMEGWTNSNSCYNQNWAQGSNHLEYNSTQTYTYQRGVILSPEIDAGAAASASLTFSHAYVANYNARYDGHFLAYRTKAEGGAWSGWSHLGTSGANGYNDSQSNRYNPIVWPCNSSYYSYAKFYGNSSSYKTSQSVAVSLAGKEKVQFAFAARTYYYSGRYWRLDWVEVNKSQECVSETRTEVDGILVDLPDAPPAPSAAAYTESCDSTVIDGGTAAGVTYYWQTAATGTALTDAQTKAFTTDQTAYLRSRMDAGPNCWSNSESTTTVAVDVNNTPTPAPTISGQTQSCGSTELAATALPAETTTVQYDYTNSYDGWTVYNDSSCIKQETWDKQSTYVEMYSNSNYYYSSALASPVYAVEGSTSITLEFNHTFYFPSTYDSGFVAYRKKVAGAWETWTPVPYGGTGWASSGYNDSSERAYNDAVRGAGYNCDSYRTLPRFSGGATTWTSKTAAISLTGATDFQWAFVAAPRYSGRYWRIHWSKVSIVKPSSSTLYWQDSATGTSTEFSGTTYTETENNKPVYLRAKNNTLDCWSDAASTVADVIEVPQAPLTAGGARCGPGSVTLTAGASPDSYGWYDAETGGNRVGSSQSYATPTIEETQTWWAASVVPYTGSTTTWNFNNTYDGWSKHNQSTCGQSNGYWTTNSSYLRNYDGNNGWRSQAMRSPVVDVSAAGSVSFEMRHMYYSYNTNRDNYRVMYRLDGGDWQQWTPTAGRTYNGNQPHRFASTYAGCDSSTVPTWYGNQSWTNSSGTIDVSTASTLELAFSATSYYYSGYWYIDWAKVTLMNECVSTERTAAVAEVDNGVAPPVPALVDAQCGVTYVHPPTAPSGYTYYWQTSPTGESTAFSGTLTVSSDATWYLRSHKNASPGCWSSPRTVVVDVNEIPSAPTILSEAKHCAYTTLTRDDPSAGITWYWQGTDPVGEAVTHSDVTYDALEAGPHYLRARDDTSGCWSTAASWNVTQVIALPAAPTAADGTRCGPGTLNVGVSGSTGSYKWYDAASGGAAFQTSGAYTTPSLDETTVYYVSATQDISQGTEWTFDSDLDGWVNNNLNSCSPKRSWDWNGGRARFYWSSYNGSYVTGLLRSPLVDVSSQSAVTFELNHHWYVTHSGAGYQVWYRLDGGAWQTLQMAGTTNRTVSNNPARTSCGAKSGYTFHGSGNTTSISGSINVSGASTIEFGLGANRVYNNRYWYVNSAKVSFSETCESFPRTAVTATVGIIPELPEVPTESPECDLTTLNKGTPGDPATWYWQGTTCGSETSNSLASYEVTTDGTYNLRARSTSYPFCWSECTEKVVDVHSKPATPAAPQISTYDCGAATLIRSAPPADETWYWQGDSCGQSTALGSAETFQVTASGTYYLRSKNDTVGCWSDTCSAVTVVVSAAPVGMPDAPTVQSEECQYTRLERGAPPAGVTWYWQGTSCGTDRSDSGATYDAEATGTYYLRAQLDASGCWSTTCTEVVVDTVLDCCDYPWGNHAYGDEYLDNFFDYTMGYEFKPDVNGHISHLGGKFNGTKTVKLWQVYPTTILLASVEVTSSNDFEYEAIPAVGVYKDYKYVVAVYLDGDGASFRSNVFLPDTFKDVEIITGRYQAGDSGASPPSGVNPNMVAGQADVRFCAYEL